jgi:hypothetical protein
MFGSLMGAAREASRVKVLESHAVTERGRLLQGIASDVDTALAVARQIALSLGANEYAEALMDMRQTNVFCAAEAMETEHA